MYDICNFGNDKRSIVKYVSSSMISEGYSESEVRAYIRKSKGWDYDTLVLESSLIIDRMNEAYWSEMSEEELY